MSTPGASSDFNPTASSGAARGPWWAQRADVPCRRAQSAPCTRVPSSTRSCSLLGFVAPFQTSSSCGFCLGRFSLRSFCGEISTGGVALAGRCPQSFAPPREAARCPSLQRGRGRGAGSGNLAAETRSAGTALKGRRALSRGAAKALCAPRGPELRGPRGAGSPCRGAARRWLFHLLLAQRQGS